MLNSFRNNLKIIRSFQTSSSSWKTNKEWLAIKRQSKAEDDKKWNRRENSNPFQSNIGIRHQLKGLGLRDPSDPKVVSRLDFRELGYEEGLTDRLEETLEATDKFQNELAGFKKNKSNVSPAVLRRVLTKKRFFPDLQSPNLLTFMENLTIRNLHASDPVEWSIERLSECFPATPSTIAKIVRRKKSQTIHPKAIQKHDSSVRNNWAKLLDGQLEVPGDLMRHLVENFEKISGGVQTYMSDSSYKDLEGSILQSLEKQFEPMRREVKGEFGLIIADYKKKVQQIQQKNSEKPELAQTEFVVDKDTMLEQPDYQIDMPNPYGGTSFIRSNIDFRKERSMTMDQFKKKFLDSKLHRHFGQKSEKFNSIKNNSSKKEVSLYFDWLKEENAKDEFAKLNPAQKLSKEEIDEEVQIANQERFIQLPKKYLQKKNSKSDEESEKVLIDLRSKNVSDAIELKVAIPESQYKLGAIYRLKNCFYDSNGDFLYKTPSVK